MNKHHHQKLLDTSMARSDSGLTTWSKLKKRSSENQLRRHPSGNNNNNTSADEMTSFSNLGNDNALKSQSMPNLYRQRLRWQHGTSNTANCCGGHNIMSSSSVSNIFVMRTVAAPHKSNVLERDSVDIFYTLLTHCAYGYILFLTITRERYKLETSNLKALLQIKQ